MKSERLSGSLQRSAALPFCFLSSIACGYSNDQIPIATAANAESTMARHENILPTEILRQSAVREATVFEQQFDSDSLAKGWLRVELHTTRSSSEKTGLPELPNATGPGPEGFTIRRNRDVIQIIGVEVRGTGVSQGHTITQFMGSRAWTVEEWQRAVVGYELVGANTFSMGYGVNENDPQYWFVRRLGMKVLLAHNPNQGTGEPQWSAKEAIGRSGYLCLSVPEARALKMAAENGARRTEDAPTQ